MQSNDLLGTGPGPPPCQHGHEILDVCVCERSDFLFRKPPYRGIGKLAREFLAKLTLDDSHRINLADRDRHEIPLPARDKT